MKKILITGLFALFAALSVSMASTDEPDERISIDNQTEYVQSLAVITPMEKGIAVILVEDSHYIAKEFAYLAASIDREVILINAKDVDRPDRTDFKADLHRISKMLITDLKLAEDRSSDMIEERSYQKKFTARNQGKPNKGHTNKKFSFGSQQRS